MIKQLNRVLDEILNDEKCLPTIAKITKKIFDELVKEGFNEDQALALVANLASRYQSE